MFSTNCKFILWKDNLNSNCTQFHRYQQNEQSPLILRIPPHAWRVPVVHSIILNDFFKDFCVILLGVFTFLVPWFPLRFPRLYLQWFVGGRMPYLCCLHIVMSNTYCVVILFCFSSFCAPCVASSSWLSIFKYIIIVFSSDFTISHSVSKLALFRINYIHLTPITIWNLIYTVILYEVVLTVNVTQILKASWYNNGNSAD